MDDRRPDDSSTAEARKRRVAWRVFAGGMVVALLALLIVTQVNASRGKDKVYGKTKDYHRWYRVARRVIEGRPLAVEPMPPELKFNRQPPTFAVYVSPLGYLSYRAYLVAWGLLLGACAAGSLLIAMKMIHGRWIPTDPRLMIIPALATLPFIWDEIALGNNNLPLQLLIFAGVYLAWRGRELIGGSAVGLAISLKFFPVAIVPALLLIRRWKTAVAAVLSVAIWTLLIPGLVRGFDRHWTETRIWYDRVIGPYAGGPPPNEQWESEWANEGTSAKNQSTWALVQRLTEPNEIRKPGPGPRGQWPQLWTVNLIHVTKTTQMAIFVGLMLVAMGAIGAVGLRRGSPDDRIGPAAAFAAAITFILVASPIVWTYYYALLMLAMAVGAAVLVEGDRAGRRVMGTVWIVTLLLIPAGLWVWSRAYGPWTLMAAIWMAAMLWLRGRRTRQDESGSPPISSRSAGRT
jgi:hypothetical protein